MNPRSFETKLVPVADATLPRSSSSKPIDLLKSISWMVPLVSRESFELLEAAASKPKEKISYRDPFQEQVGSRVEELGKRLEGQGRNVLYMIAALVVLAVVIGVIYLVTSRSNAAAQTALGKAIETSQ